MPHQYRFHRTGRNEQRVIAPCRSLRHNSGPLRCNIFVSVWFLSRERISVSRPKKRLVSTRRSWQASHETLVPVRWKEGKNFTHPWQPTKLNGSITLTHGAARSQQGAEQQKPKSHLAQQQPGQGILDRAKLALLDCCIAPTERF